MTQERRLLLAFALSALVLLVWQTWIMPPPPPPLEGETMPAGVPAADRPPAPAPSSTAAMPPAPETAPPAVLALSNQDLALEIASEGGVLTDLFLPRYRRHGAGDSPVDLVGSEVRAVPRLHPLALVADTEDLGGLGRWPHAIVETGPRAVTLRAAPHPLLGPVRVEKRLEIDEAGHRATLVVRLVNPTETPAAVTAARLDFPDGTRKAGSLLLHWSDLGRNGPPPLWRDQHAVTASYMDEGGKVRTPTIDPGFFSGLWGPPAPPLDIRWAAVQNRYFVSAILPRFEGAAAHFESGPADPDAGPAHTTDLYVLLPPANLPPGARIEYPFTLHLGPKSTDGLVATDARLRPLDGMEPSVLPFSLARPTVKILRFLQGLTGNYGWAIITITILIRIVLAPLTIAQIRSMERMKALQPKIEELKAKFGDDKERLNREVLKVYAEGGANPLGGCLPILLQIPVFVALYQALQWSIDLRGAPFVLWMRDLSAPDTVFTLAGIPVNILPALMGATMLWQQKISTPPSTDPSQAQTMQMMTVVMTVLFWNLPSGLTLYWTVQNILSIAQQYAMEWRRAHAR